MSDLAGGLKDLMGTGPASLTTFFQRHKKASGCINNALAVQGAPPLPSFTGDNVARG